jgi:peptidoglycan/xylan/chitin deacetylase (PgdA/CDA1 family)
MLKRLIKKAVYHSGCLKVYHLIRNSNSLTVVMFHRVLAKEDPRWPEAEKEWTVSVDFFESCLRFFRKHYNLVTLDDLLLAYESGKSMPKRPLLITFDDGWSDNEQYALPVLKKYNAPALLFVTSGMIGKKITIWQSALYGAYQAGVVTSELCKDIWSRAGLPEDEIPDCWDKEENINRLISQLFRQPWEKIQEIIPIVMELVPHLSGTPLMLSEEELRHLYKEGIGIGSHGVTHTPIPHSKKPTMELEDSRKQIGQLLWGGDNGIPLSFSFPHSVVDRKSIKLSRKVGYKLLFTGKSCLNLICRNDKSERIFGRVNVHQGMLSDRCGHFQPELMALYLFGKPHSALSIDSFK